jgi:hypothetical protein
MWGVWQSVSIVTEVMYYGEFERITNFIIYALKLGEKKRHNFSLGRDLGLVYMTTQNNNKHIFATAIRCINF